MRRKGALARVRDKVGLGEDEAGGAELREAEHEQLGVVQLVEKEGLHDDAHRDGDTHAHDWQCKFWQHGRRYDHDGAQELNCRHGEKEAASDRARQSDVLGDKVELVLPHHQAPGRILEIGECRQERRDAHEERGRSGVRRRRLLGGAEAAGIFGAARSLDIKHDFCDDASSLEVPDRLATLRYLS